MLPRQTGKRVWRCCTVLRWFRSGASSARRDDRDLGHGEHAVEDGEPEDDEQFEG
jgi:hypothetical protein